MRRFQLLPLLLLAACGDPNVVLPEVLTVLNVFPSHGAIDVGPSVEPYVFFSHTVADTASATQAIRLECLGGGSCATPDAGACGSAPTVAISFNAEAQSARLSPSTALRAASCWVVVVESGIEARGADVGPLPVEMRSSFQTR